ncbi:hypothetical protein [Paracoccus litorisediminis]|uniref:Uncharacterized protein n=1 Tax=Paracoccus litorisediminis TaxID=2006130 RepID=A0A844HYM4_9RHOB|nr:hypothetical protein [Paracoccus litorisediminis]MTH62551.1 hypothetical protein [Paracoccus litorisediminis]
MAFGITDWISDMRHKLFLLIPLLLSACIFDDRYAAEVGYFEGEDIRWEVWGDFETLEDCQDAAITRYNFYAADKRAQSWSCLKKNSDGGYESRHR